MTKDLVNVDTGFMVSFRRFAIFLFLLSSVSSEASALDFNNDGASDFLTTTLSTNLAWKAVNSQDDTTLFNESFGLSTDFPVSGNWIDDTSPSLAVCRSDLTRQRVVWKLLQEDGTILQSTFGKPGDLILSGGDVNGDGKIDGVAVRSDSRGFQWSVATKLFTSSATRSYRFGKAPSRALLARPQGTHDWLGTFAIGKRGRTRIGVLTFRDPLSKRLLTYRGFQGAVVEDIRPRPLPVRGSSGVDILTFISQDESDTTLTFYRLKGTKLGQVTFPGINTSSDYSGVAVGDYLPDDEGEEVAFQTSDKLYLYNPFSKTVVRKDAIAGTLQGKYHAISIAAPLPTPTVAPTPTSTPAS